MPDDPTISRGQNDRFATTQWSLVLRAQAKPKELANEEDAARALAALCESYWYPLYAFLRRQGDDCHTAADHTQGFFAYLFDLGRLSAADPERGRFRSFLLAALKNYVANARRHERAEKRGGGAMHVALDFEQGEERYRHEPADLLTPDRIFERRWALTVLDRTLANLEQDYRAAGKEILFAELKDFLAGDDSRPQQVTAERLGMTAGAVKVALHRLRQRWRDLLRAEVAATVDSTEELDDEIRRLFEAVGS